MEEDNVDTYGSVRAWFQQARVEKCLDALRKNEFDAHYAPDAETAKELILSLVPPGARVAVGGSVTIREMGLPEILQERGHCVEDAWQRFENQEEAQESARRRLLADVFLCSTNALTVDGKLINVDGSGTRVNAMIFGPRRVIVVAGVNKLVRDTEEGIWRAKNVAAPMVYRGKSAHTPCAVSGRCTSCLPPTRQCRVVTIIEARPRANTDFHVVIVGERLGY
ncbi:MAG TPA: LUD domain-containing protein [Firmicutes bacterium]|nr:LUD domain-containing protein [Bacillota bacterium]